MNSSNVFANTTIKPLSLMTEKAKKVAQNKH
jgi:hypothetical protein